MFWRFHLQSSNIDPILDKPDVTLQEILDEDDVLQECKAQNCKLISFLVGHLNELVNMVITEPGEELDQLQRFKYPNIACELLTSDVNDITDKLVEDRERLEKICSCLDTDKPINPLMASFFSKLMGLLITRKSAAMVELLKTKEGFVQNLLNHIGTSAIMDLLLRLITCIDNPDNRRECIQWLKDELLIEKLIAMVDPVHTSDKHCNAAQVLVDIIRLSREQMSIRQDQSESDPLLTLIESKEMVSELLRHMFDGEVVESVIVNGLSILQNLLEFKKLSTEGLTEQMTNLDAERLAAGASCTMQAIVPRLKEFQQVLLTPPFSL